MMVKIFQIKYKFFHFVLGMPIFLIFLSGCSSQSQNSGFSPDSETSASRNLSFDTSSGKGLQSSVVSTRYNSETDFYSLDYEDNGDVLIKETFFKLSNRKLSNLSGKDELIRDPLTQLAVLCYQKKFSDALRLNTKIYPQYKKNPRYWNQVGTCYQQQGNLRLAQLYYNKALDLNQKHSPSLNNLGVLYARMGKEQKAEAAFERAISASPFSFTPLYNKAQLYLAFGLPQKAASSFFVLYKKFSDDKQVNFGLAQSLLYSSRLQDAVKIQADICDQGNNKDICKRLSND